MSVERGRRRVRDSGGRHKTCTDLLTLVIAYFKLPAYYIPVSFPASCAHVMTVVTSVAVCIELEL